MLFVVCAVAVFCAVCALICAAISVALAVKNKRLKKKEGACAPVFTDCTEEPNLPTLPSVTELVAESPVKESPAPLVSYKTTVKRADKLLLESAATPARNLDELIAELARRACISKKSAASSASRRSLDIKAERSDEEPKHIASESGKVLKHTARKPIKPKKG